MSYSKKPKKKEAVGKLRNKAMGLFQRLRRLEESKNGYVVCISCGKSVPWQEAQGGHFISRQCRATETEKDNVNPQCVQCNVMNHGAYHDYRHNLIQKIGEERVERLETLYRASRGSDEDYERLSPMDRALVSEKRGISYYREKIAEFEKRIKEIENGKDRK